jgi:hypothetical protein
MLDTEHKYNTIKDTMEVPHIEKKCQLLNTLERFYMCNFWKQKLQVHITLYLIFNHTPTSPRSINMDAY